MLCGKIIKASEENMIDLMLQNLSGDEMNLLLDVIKFNVVSNEHFKQKLSLLSSDKRKIIRDIIKHISYPDDDLKDRDKIINIIDNYNDLHIEPLQEKYKEGLYTIAQETDTMSHIGRGNTWTMADIDKIMINDFRSYVIIKANTVIGYIGLRKTHVDTPQLRIFLGKRFTGQGYAKKSIEILKTVFTEEFYAVVRKDNITSNKLIQSSGLTFIGVKHIYGSQHNIYKYFVEKYSYVFYTPNTSKNGLQFTELDKILQRRSLTFSQNNSSYIFAWPGYNKKLYTLPCLIKSIINDNKCITDKLNLYTNMLQFNSITAEKHMSYTCQLIDGIPIGILSGNRIKLVENKYYIIRPVNGYSGDGISVINRLSEIESAYHYANKIKGPIILSDYIQDIMLYKNKKFHIRVYLLVLIKNTHYYTFLWNVGKIMTASSNYDQFNKDKDNFDTHLKSTTGDIFLNDLENEIGNNKFTKIIQDITNILYNVSNMIKPFIENYAENKYGFEVYAADILVKSDGTPILLEINDRVGYDMNNPELTTAFSKEYFNWIDGCVFSRIFGDKEPISPLFEDDLTTPNTITHRKFLGMYGLNYEKAKIELPILIEYPYLRYYKSIENIYSDFKKLQNHNYTISEEPYNLHNIKLKTEKLKFNNKFKRIISKTDELQTINSITDYFSEDVRVHCKFLSNSSIYEYYNKNIPIIIDNMKRNRIPITLEEIREYLWSSKIRQCTTFKPKIIKYIIEFFSSKNILDISSGWGDRLIGTMASNAKLYHGFDPNLKLYPKYREIIDFFKSINHTIECKVEPIPFEEAVLQPEYYDLVMSSPPYFTMEIYTIDTGQSIFSNPDERTWFENYLLKWIDKSKLGLKKGGILALNINQEKDKQYVNWLLEYMDTADSGFEYIGMIGYSNEDGKNPQPIFIWRKKLDETYYNKVNGSGMYTIAMRQFHNIIKSKLINSVSNKDDILIDLAVGKGSDISKWSKSKLKFVLGIDIVKDNIENTLDGAIVRYNKLKSLDKNVPTTIFLHGNSSLNLENGDAFFNESDKIIFNELISKEKFDVCSIQFALHYMFKSSQTLHNFLTNVKDVTKVGGYFIGTSYDGKKVFNLLKDRQNIVLTVNNMKIWEITKKYNGVTFPDNDQSLGYSIDVFQDSINNTFTEYLVNYTYLTEEIKKYGFRLLSKDEYKELGLPSSLGSFNEFGGNLSPDEKTISYLNKFFIYKKIF